jgi:PAS domain S-box-containing protein
MIMTGSRRNTLATPGGTETILVAEDEPLVRDLTVCIFENAGYTALAASDGEEALQIADQEALETLSATFVEVLGRQRAQTSLAQSEKRYRELLGAVTAYTYSVAVENGTPMSTKHSLGCLAATGYTREEYAADSNLWISMVHPNDREMVQRQIAVVLAGEDVTPIEHRIIRRDGTVRWIRDAIIQHYDDGGQLVRYDGVVEDITERKQAEEALREHDQLLEAVFDSVDCAIVSCNAEGILTYSNRALRQLCGLSQHAIQAEQLLEKCDFYLADGTTRMGREELPLFRALSGEHFQSVEMMLMPQDGGARTLLAGGQPLVNAEGRPHGAVLTMRDVTEHTQRLRNKDAELRQAQKMEAIGGLAGGIAHEFNNLLQAIQGYTRYAMEDLPADEQRYQDLETVLKAADRAQTLTRQLLGFSRQQLLQRKHVEVNAVVSDVFKILRPIIGEHIGVKVELDDAPTVVDADPNELQQVLLNLCINARDAMPSGGELLLKTASTVLGQDFCPVRTGATPDPYVALSVTDTGCGMPPEVRDRIFDPFFTTKEVGKGTGLGLATSYGIVQQHRGAIHVDSEPGKGATFTIYLPKVDQVAENEATQAGTSALGGTETILLAEDEPMVRDITRRVLEKAGYTVFTAADGEEALRVFEDNRDAISLALLDVVMPKLSGHDVYRRIKAEKPETKTVFSTGYDPETARSGFTEEENVRLIQKPFEPDVLLNYVREILDEREACQLAEATS